MSPIWMISGSVSNRWKKGVEKKAPYRANSTQVATASRMPWVAAALASSCKPWPSRREIREVTPTAVPTAKAMSRFCRGKARLTAARAFSLTWATK